MFYASKIAAKLKPTIIHIEHAPNKWFCLHSLLFSLFTNMALCSIASIFEILENEPNVLSMKWIWNSSVALHLKKFPGKYFRLQIVFWNFHTSYSIRMYPKHHHDIFWLSHAWRSANEIGGKSKQFRQFEWTIAAKWNEGVLRCYVHSNARLQLTSWRFWVRWTLFRIWLKWIFKILVWDLDQKFQCITYGLVGTAHRP